MKPLIITVSVLIICSVAGAFADSKVQAGPRHGRMLPLSTSTAATSNAEFLIEKDRTVSIAFYDAAMKQQSPADQVVVATAEAPAGKKKIEFEKKGNLLVSKEPLPEGEHYNIVVQVKEKADAKPQNFRIKLDLAMCGE